MSPRHRVTLRSQWLGHLLRDLRETNGLTLKEVGEYLQRDLSMVSRFESGVYPIRRGDVMALLDLYDVEGQQQRDALLQLATEVWRKGWWEKYAGHVEGSLIDLVWLENRATSVRGYSLFPITALVQIPEYADALIRTADPQADDRQVERWVELRMARQRVLEGDEPVQLSIVLDEAALRRPVGGAEVMSRQLSHLVACGERPNIDIRVLPFSVGAHASPDGGFRLLKMPHPFSEIAHVEGPGGALYLESAEAERLAGLYDRLEDAALGPAESTEFLSAIVKELR